MKAHQQDAYPRRVRWLALAAGVIGSLQALEALKLLAGLDGALLDAFLQVDLYDHAFLRVSVTRRADCPDCGTL